jgi:deazaflavin-dependent oxidoreductase (nitroreductase family)
MPSHKQPPTFIWRFMRRLSRRVIHLVAAGRGPAGVVLVLTTTGRKSGLPRQTPLQYEQVGADFYIASARGPQADWFRNLQAEPRVAVLVGGRQFPAQAEAVTDPARIADFLALRLERHPRMVGLIMRLEGFPLRYTRLDLEQFAAGKALAVLHPLPQAE